MASNVLKSLNDCYHFSSDDTNSTTKAKRRPQPPKSATKKSVRSAKRCQLFADIVSAAVWVHGVRADSRVAADSVLEMLTRHMLDGCTCVALSSTYLLIGNTHLERFLLNVNDFERKVDSEEKTSQTTTDCNNSHNPAINDIHVQKDSKLDSNVMPELVDMKNVSALLAPVDEAVDHWSLALASDNVSALLAPVDEAVDHWSLALASDVKSRVLSEEIVVKMRLYYNLYSVIEIYGFYKRFSSRFKATKLLNEFITQCSNKYSEMALIANYYLVTNYIHLGALRKAKASLIQITSSSSASAYQSMPDSFGKSLNLLAKCELNLMSGRPERAAKTLQLFLESDYLLKLTINRYYIKGLTLMLATKFTSQQFNFSKNFREFLEPIQMSVCILKRWHPWLSPNRANNENVINSGDVDPLWYRYGVMSFAFDALTLSTNFYINIEIPSDSFHYYNSLLRLGRRQCATVRLSELLIIGSKLDVICDHKYAAQAKLNNASLILQSTLLSSDSSVFSSDSIVSSISPQTKQPNTGLRDARHQSLPIDPQIDIKSADCSADVHPSEYDDCEHNHMSSAWEVKQKLRNIDNNSDDSSEDSILERDKLEVDIKEYEEAVNTCHRITISQTYSYGERLSQSNLLYLNAFSMFALYLDKHHIKGDKLWVEFNSSRFESVGDLSCHSPQVLTPPRANPLKSMAPKAPKHRAFKNTEIEDYVTALSNKLYDESKSSTSCQTSDTNIFGSKNNLKLFEMDSEMRSLSVSDLNSATNLKSDVIVADVFSKPKSKPKSIVNKRTTRSSSKLNENILNIDEKSSKRLKSSSNKSSKGKTSEVSDSAKDLQFVDLEELDDVFEQKLVISDETKVFSKEDSYDLQSIVALLKTGFGLMASHPSCKLYVSIHKLLAQIYSMEEMVNESFVGYHYCETNDFNYRSNASITNRDRETFWNLRHSLDDELSLLLRSVEETWFGAFRGILLGQIQSKRYEQMCNTLMAYIMNLAQNDGLVCNSKSLFKVMVESLPSLKYHEYKVAMKTLFNSPSDDLILKCFEKYEQLFCEFFPIDNKEEVFTTYGLSPVGLILDKSLQKFPFESLPTLQAYNQSIFRTPSLRILSLMYNTFKDNIYSKGVDESSVYYVVNPSDNLEKTQDFFKESFMARSEWNGVIGRVPQPNELKNALNSADTYIYFGHGAGGTYFRTIPDGLDGCHINCASIVMGCSSGRLTSEGKHLEPYGAAHRFIMNGCPCYVGVLWDVTDKDIDKFSDQLLTYWFSKWKPEVNDTKRKTNVSIATAVSMSRKVCRLKALIGAATVVYGFGGNRWTHVLTHVLTTQTLRASTACPTVLGIETSCDETGIAIVDQNGSILADVCRSQLKTHLSNGGIIPPVARSLHQKCIDDCVRQCLERADMSADQLSAIAVTVKPGLPLSLVIGKNYAKALALKYRKPVIPVHHMEAHALMATINNQSLDFPFITLLISGGHCLLAIARDITKFELLGQSIDCAPGDVMDKIARRLRLRNLGPPYDELCGGAALELCAKSGDPLKYITDVNQYPMYCSPQRCCRFSFSGFHTLVFRLIENLEKKSQTPPDGVLSEANDICASIQYAMTFMLIKKLQRALIFIRWNDMFEGKPIKLVISGGCASNEFITNTITNYCHSEDIEVHIPPKKLCSDNGIMIAWNGVLKLLNEHKYPDLILRDEQLIQELDITGKASFGEDISHQVISEHIKCDTFDVKQFIRQ
ncbi:unnamed protein product [Oppiella nova]|uniref:N(6)-L-threonylcarbamoyladenine synthase n=1 Tax=Oppiella nova TaxID=334625 RepID=A0A7R9QLR0_9ACAR|nr:unnamed protein product [Oppiella nova]CAG2167509.1 unnamed protein product [Oppiella nova]